MTVLPIDDPLAERAWSQEESIHGPDAPEDGGAAFVLLWAVVHGLRNAWRLVFGGGDVLSALVKPQICPDDLLPLSAAIQGVRLPPGISVEAQRDLVETRPAQSRGLPEARKAAIRAHLTGSKYVRLDEQVTSAYTETITVKPSQIVTSLAEITRVAMEMKPAGIVLTVQAVETALWADEAAAHPSWSDAATEHPTWSDMAGGHP